MVTRGKLMDLLDKIMTDFNARVGSDPTLKKKVEGVTKKIIFRIKDEPQCFMMLENCELRQVYYLDFLCDQEFDIIVESDRDTMTKVLNKELDPMKVFGKTLTVKASFGDMLLMKRVL